MPTNDKKTPRIKLTKHEERVALMLASGVARAEIGKQIGKSVWTVNRLAIQPNIRAEVDAIRGAAIEAGLGKLCEACSRAADEIVRIITSGSNQDSVRLGAARLIIESAVKVRDAVELTRRIEVLEAAQAGRKVD